MGLIRNIRRALSDRAPVPSQARRRAAQRAMPAARIGAPQARSFTEGDFTARQQVVGVLSVLAQIVVPKGSAYIFDTRRPFRLWLPAVEAGQIAADASTSLAVTLANGLVEDHRGDPVVYISDDGVAYVETPVTAVDYDANEVTFTKTATTTHYRIVHATASGVVSVHALGPGEAPDSHSRLYNVAARALQVRDQGTGDTAPYLRTGNGGSIQLPQDWRLAICVDSQQAYTWADYVGMDVELPGAVQQLDVRDAAGLNALVRGARGR